MRLSCWLPMLVLFSAMLSAGCVGVGRYPFVPPIGGVFTAVSTPIDFQAKEDPDMDGRAETSSHNVLGLLTWGSMSANEAAVRGRLARMDHAEVQILRIIGVYTRTKIQVYGPYEN